MNELQLAFTLPGVEQNKLGPWLKSWQLGQVLQARVVNQSPSGSLVLRIGGHQLTATADFQAQKGALLSLEVTGLFPTASMKVINTPMPGPALANPLEGQLQLLLSRQGSVLTPLATLLEPAQRVNLLSLLSVKNGVLDNIRNSLSPIELLTDPRTLQKALLQSGFFLESDLLRLANSGGFLSRVDIKAMLFRLLQKTNQASNRPGAALSNSKAQEILAALQTELQGAIATITLNQLAAGQVKERDGLFWLFDMPFRVRDSLSRLSVSIEREGSAPQDQPELQEWRIVFNIILPRLGTIEAELFVRGSKVSVVFYSQQERTILIMEERLPRIKAALQNRGLDLAVLRCQLGSRPGGGKKAPWTECVDERI